MSGGIGLWMVALCSPGGAVLLGDGMAGFHGGTVLLGILLQVKVEISIKSREK